jgi:8-oxo-dGTP diphosphatase
MEENPTMLHVVAAALTTKDGRILVQKRPEGRAMAGLWEFPGGKLDPAETPEEALIRELNEELGIGVEACDLVPCTFASEDLDGKRLVLLLYRCRKWSGEPMPLDGQEIRWVDTEAMKLLQMPPADAPFIAFLERN